MLPPCLASQICRQDAKRGRRQTVEPARLPHRAGTRSLELRAGLVGKSGHVGIVNFRQDQTLIAAEGIDIGGLTLEIDIVFGI